MSGGWPGMSDEGHSYRYIERFRTMAAQGVDLEGEARLVDALVDRHARILDAGCGPGRVAGALHARGHRVVGVDIDPRLVAAAEQDHPGPRYLVGDLADLDAAAVGSGFDAVVCAGNVMVFLVPGTEPAVLAGIAAALRPDGVAVVGFDVHRHPLAGFDAAVAGTDLAVEHRFATWDLRPWQADADFAVTVLRKP